MAAAARIRTMTAVLLVACAACSLDAAGILSASSSSDGGSVDATVAGDAAPNGGDATIDDAGDAGLVSDARPIVDVLDAGPMDVAPPPPDAAPIVFNCPSGATADCATCTGRPLGCVMCATTGTDVYAVCVPLGSSCYASYRPTGYDWCRCTPGDASTCVLGTQECNTYAGGVCVTCGENATEGFPCKAGGTCSQSSHVCR